MEQAPFASDLMHGLLESSPVGALVSDGVGRLVFVNQILGSWAGLSPDDVASLTVGKAPGRVPARRPCCLPAWRLVKVRIRSNWIWSATMARSSG